MPCIPHWALHCQKFHTRNNNSCQVGRLADRDTEEEDEEEERDDDEDEDEVVVVDDDDDFCLAAVTRAWWQLMQILTGVV
jgi:hypothetical protein